MNKKEDLEFLQKLSEIELTELVIIPLLMSMGYENIRNTHGVLEQGKDIVFNSLDPLSGIQNYAAAIKSKPLNGSVSSNKSINEVFFQVKQALKQPYIDPFDGREVDINSVYVITPFPINQHTALSIKGELSEASNRVNFIDGDQMVSLIYKHSPALLLEKNDPAKRYLHRVCHRFLNNPSLGSVGDAHKSIIDLYTGGYLSPTSKEDAKYISFALPSIGKEKLKLGNLLEDKNHLVVLADVGTGKTTLLQKLLLDAGGFSGKEVAILKDKYTPIFVPLSQICHDELFSFDEFIKKIDFYINSEDKFTEFDINNEKYLILLDGFDEVYIGHDNVAEWITRLSSESNCGIVITSRPSRIPALGNDFHYYQLLQLTDEEIKLFIRKAYPGDIELQEGMYKRITSNETLKAFCRTPLILTLYTILGHKYTVDQLPTRKTDIYNSIIEMLLGDWDRLRKVKNQFSVDLKEYILEKIAYKAHLSRKKDFDKDDLIAIVSEVMDSRRLKNSPEAIFNELIYRSSLIRRASSSQENSQSFEFVHLSFQEFFAAKNILRNQDISTIQSFLFDDWWKNSILFFFGLRRNLDGIQIQTGRRQDVNGIALLEYLAEADYTDDTTKNNIYSIIGKHLIKVKPNENDLKIISSFGDEVALILVQIIDDQQELMTPTVITNVFILFSTINTRTSDQYLLSNSKLLNVLTMKQMAEILYRQIPMVKYEESHDCIINTLESLKVHMNSKRYRSEEEKNFVLDSLSHFKGSMNHQIKSGTLNSKSTDRISVRLRKVRQAAKSAKTT